jgi:Cu(I)/Ag(I) efflux system membrane fusion protein
MKLINNTLIKSITIAVPCLFFGGWLALNFFATNQTDTKSADSEEAQPMYWVAPMDANFRRDGPGLSPMGMDLVPVYKNEGSEGEGPGTVKISPNVINNIGVRTERVQRSYLQTEVKTVAYVNYNQDKLVHIHPRVKGWVETLNINAVGDTVEKGQAIYSIYSPELVNAQEEFVLAITRKNARLIKAARNRLQALNLPDNAIDELQRSHKVQQQVTFYAPQSGVVENLSIREGFYVQPGTMLFSIGDLTEVWVEAEVLERQAGFIFVDDKVSMTLDFLPGKTWQGMVDYIYPTLDKKTRTMKVRLRFNNENLALKPNMFAQVIIHGKPTDETIIIAKEALIRTGTQDRVVLALGDGKFKSIAVDVGRSDGQKIEILSGLSEDDTIVTSAQFLLDSESSKNSDFKRMSAMTDMDMENTPQPVAHAQVVGIVNTIDANNRILNISRGPIEKWQRPAATLDFYVASNIDLSQFSKGLKINFTFAIENGEFTLITIHDDIDHANASEMH